MFNPKPARTIRSALLTALNDALGEDAMDDILRATGNEGTSRRVACGPAFMGPDHSVI